jgi:hypothetical protein
MIIEYQFPSETFLTNSRNALRSLDFCRADPISSPILKNCGAGPVYLDRVDIGMNPSSTSMRRTPEGLLQVVQAARIRLVNEGVLRKSGKDLGLACLDADFKLVFTVEIVVLLGTPYLHIVCGGVEAEDQALAQLLTGLLNAVPTTLLTAIPLGDVTDTLGTGYRSSRGQAAN